MPRMTILHAAERQAYETPPILDAAQRSRAFDLPAGLLDMAKALRKPAHQIGFLVSCAYFGMAKRFFAPKDYHARDIRHAAHQLELPGVHRGRLSRPHAVTARAADPAVSWLPALR